MRKISENPFPPSVLNKNPLRNFKKEASPVFIESDNLSEAEGSIETPFIFFSILSSRASAFLNSSISHTVLLNAACASSSASSSSFASTADNFDLSICFAAAILFLMPRENLPSLN